MKRIAVLLIVVLVAFVSCNKDKKNEQKEHAAIESVLTKWVFAIETEEYSLYKELESNPLPEPDFIERYKEYYYQNIQVLVYHTKKSDDVDGELHEIIEVEIAAETVERESSQPKGMINGTIELVRESREDSLWKIRNKTVIRNH